MHAHSPQSRCAPLSLRPQQISTAVPQPHAAAWRWQAGCCGPTAGAPRCTSQPPACLLFAGASLAWLNKCTRVFQPPRLQIATWKSVVLGGLALGSLGVAAAANADGLAALWSGYSDPTSWAALGWAGLGPGALASYLHVTVRGAHALRCLTWCWGAQLASERQCRPDPSNCAHGAHRIQLPHASVPCRPRSPSPLLPRCCRARSMLLQRRRKSYSVPSRSGPPAWPGCCWAARSWGPSPGQEARPWRQRAWWPPLRRRRGRSRRRRRPSASERGPGAATHRFCVPSTKADAVFSRRIYPGIYLPIIMASRLIALDLSFSSAARAVSQWSMPGPEHAPNAWPSLGPSSVLFAPDTFTGPNGCPSPPFGGCKHSLAESRLGCQVQRSGTAAAAHAARALTGRPPEAALGRLGTACTHLQTTRESVGRAEGA